MEIISPTDFAKEKILAVQEYATLAGRSLGNLFKRPLYVADIVQQADLIGFGSVSIIILTGFFIGGALAQNSGYTLQRFGSVSLIGQLVSLGMVRELGPLITGLMVAGRNASGMASELGSMIVTEQIDAMRALGTDPLKKLVTPRVLATTVMMFFLTIISDFAGIAGGGVASEIFFGVDTRQYWSTAWQILVFQDVFMGLAKPLLFGFIIASIGCFYGMTARGGTQGVGRATTQAVVASSILVIMVDFFITRFLMTITGH
jgi:phospholipid/cholesterol/gamma-HCH transport system permease protein